MRRRRAVRFLAGSLAFASAVVAACAAIGALLPSQHTVSRRALYRQKPSTVYSVLWGQPAWYPGFSGYKELPAVDGKRRWCVRVAAIRDRVVTFEQVDARASQLLVIRTAGDDDLPYRGSWRYEVEPHASGTMLRITETGEVRNPIYRCLARFAVGHEAGIEDYLRRLGEKFGEAVEVTD